MTDRTRKTILFGLVPVVATALMAFALRAWDSKADRVDLERKVDHLEYDAHVSASELRVIRDSAWKAEQRQMTLDILCELKISDRRCR